MGTAHSRASYSFELRTVTRVPESGIEWDNTAGAVDKIIQRDDVKFCMPGSSTLSLRRQQRVKLTLQGCSSSFAQGPQKLTETFTETAMITSKATVASKNPVILHSESLQFQRLVGVND